MHQQHHTILAIHPGTRYIGIAVISGDLLVDWGVSVITVDSPHAKVQKTRALITRYLEEYTPDIVVIKKLNPALSPEVLIRQQWEIHAVAQEHGLRVRQFSIREMERHLMPDKTINKRQLAALMVHRHPVLRHELQKEQDALNPYHIRMFEAVALGDMMKERCEHPAMKPQSV
jgi:Holliday junction resolvasome RuvABC endonuclease subunit